MRYLPAFVLAAALALPSAALAAQGGFQGPGDQYRNASPAAAETDSRAAGYQGSDRDSRYDGWHAPRHHGRTEARHRGWHRCDDPGAWRPCRAGYHHQHKSRPTRG